MFAQLLDTVRAGRLLSVVELAAVCGAVRSALVDESTVQPVAAPVIVCGSIHGQFDDLLELLRVGGTTSRYLFLGNYANHGPKSVEAVSLLLVLKAAHPGQITMIRGYHDSRQVGSIYGFYDEVMQKYGGDASVWRLFCGAFDMLPLAAVIDGAIFCVPCGLSHGARTLDQLRRIARNCETEHGSAAHDLAWLEPNETIETWDIEGNDMAFGHRVVDEFLHVNGLELICNTHKSIAEGFRYWFRRRSLVTIWSAPNHRHRGNLAATLTLDGELRRQFKVFGATPTDEREN